MIFVLPELVLLYALPAVAQSLMLCQIGLTPPCGVVYSQWQQSC
jgi:hypothetical protein